MSPAFYLRFALALDVLLAAAPALADGQIQTVAKEGVPHVMNPAASSAKPETVQLKELWRVGGDDDEDVLFGVITDIIADRDGNFYMLDSQLNEVQVYAPDGEYLRTIGREGEGPGEFRAAFNLLLMPSGNIGVLQAFPSRIIGLTPDGEPADALTLPETDDAGFKVLFAARDAGEQLAVIYGFNQPTESGFQQVSVLSLIDKTGQGEKRLHSQTSGLNSANAVFAETEWDTFRNNRWTTAPDGRVFSAVSFGEYSIKVWNPDGKLARVIERDFPTHTRSAEEKAEVRRIYEGFTRQIPFPNIQYEIEDAWNPIRALNAREDGTLWVQTSRGTVGADPGVLGRFDIFDRDGRFVRQVTLKGEGNPDTDGLFFVKDRLFVVTDWLDALMALQGGAGASEDTDEDAEPMAVICYQL